MSVAVPSIHPHAAEAAKWLTARIREAFAEELHAVAVYGPATTATYDPRYHRVHTLIVTADRDVDRLLTLAGSSKEATKRHLAPPLVATPDAMDSSRDVFPLEWLDIEQFHVVTFGELDWSAHPLRPSDLRLQCERDLRSLDLQLQRGVLASGGRPKHVDRLEREAADTLVRVLRGIVFLGGDAERRLPGELLDRTESTTGMNLPGCRQAVAEDGRHDVDTVRQMLGEIETLGRYVDGLDVS